MVRLFEHRVAIVTGAGAVGNIGEAYGHALAQEGASVVLADIDGEGAKAVARGILEAGGKALAVTSDVTSEADVRHLVAEAVRVFGGVDILVNNAGLHLSAYALPPLKLGYSAWRRLFDVNLHGAYLSAIACQPIMKSRGSGVIINQSSSDAYTPKRAYGISKLALNGLTLALAAEFGPDNIRVNGIAPGLVDSKAAMGDLRPGLKQLVLDNQMLKRQGHMSDLANMLVFLCSDQASFITGHTYLVDGGCVQQI